MVTVNEFKDKLCEGIVMFNYTKKDGSLRSAKGTLNGDLINKLNGTPKGTGLEATDENLVKYYDINAEGWRSFRFENFVEYNS